MKKEINKFKDPFFLTKQYLIFVKILMSEGIDMNKAKINAAMQLASSLADNRRLNNKEFVLYTKIVLEMVKIVRYNGYN